MLTYLEIKDIILIDNLELNFKDGFTCVTGETGAGKSIIINCIKYLLGNHKFSSDIVKNGKKQGVICGTFNSLGCVKGILESLEIECDSEIFIRRVINANGSSRNYINDMPVSVSTIQNISNDLLEIHGQAEQYKTFSEKTYIQILDQFAKTDNLLEELKFTFKALTTAQEKLSKLEKDRSELLKELELAKFAISEFESLDVKENEFNVLLNKKLLLSERSKVEGIIRDAITEFEAREIGKYFFKLQKIFVNNRDLLSKYVSYEQISKMNEEALELAFCLKDKLSEVLTYSSGESLDQVAERVLDIKELCHKYKISPEEIAIFLEERNTRISSINSLIGDHSLLSSSIYALELRYAEIATQLSCARKSSALLLEQKVMQELKLLALGRAKFKIEVLYDQNQPKSVLGYDYVSFKTIMNPGSEEQLLHKSASGGELSRLMLALKVAANDISKTFIFDEIDTGIGGAIADSVGSRLRLLGTQNQVISITHHPQVAAKGFRCKDLCKVNNLEELEFYATTPITESISSFCRLTFVLAYNN